MKLNSHLIGILIGVGAIAAWMFFVDKEVETYKDWRIIKSGGKFKVEKLKGTKDQNPAFDTIEEARRWIDAKVTLDATKGALSTMIPWGK